MQSRDRRDVLLSLGALPAGALLAGQEPRAGDARAAIEAGNHRFVKALGRGDAYGCAELYAEHARLLPPNAPMVIGWAWIQEFWVKSIAAGVRGGTLTTVEVDDLGETAIEVGTYTMDVEPAGQPAMQDRGKYVVVWKRQADGSWKMAVDIFNSDLPAPK